jgi:hypothetical protein
VECALIYDLPNNALVVLHSSRTCINCLSFNPRLVFISEAVKEVRASQHIYRFMAVFYMLDRYNIVIIHLLCELFVWVACCMITSTSWYLSGCFCRNLRNITPVSIHKTIVKVRSPTKLRRKTLRLI